MRQAKYPVGWDEARVKRVLTHYEQQSDDEAVAEDEAAYESTTHTTMEVSLDLVPAVRELLAKRRAVLVMVFMASRDVWHAFSVWRGTASTTPVAGFPHSECEPPSRLSTHPCWRRCRSNELRFTER
jgi:hypothetical protein